MTFDIKNTIDIRPKDEGYIMDEPLRQAVQLALRFDQPLLITGAPGTGKTRLAYHLAYLLQEQTKEERIAFSSTLYRFNTKTTSTAKDLFYYYDAISHFQHTNITKTTEVAARPTQDFIQLNALGLAIAATCNDTVESLLNGTSSTPPQTPKSAVVLIDEIDKAPRDFTNDLLNEIEEKEFFIKELNDLRISQKKQEQQRVLIIMTSNSEKNLPDAFLRRCVFYHIPNPDAQKMKQIIKRQLGLGMDETSELLESRLDELIELFAGIREEANSKAPTTAELVALVKLKGKSALLDTEESLVKWFQENLPLIIKTREDWQNVETFLKRQLK